MKKTVLDSFAVLAFLFKEPGHEKVLSVLDTALDEDDLIYIAAPNWAEVRYMVERKVGPSKWAEVRHKLLGLPLEIIPADQAMAELAGEIKTSNKMSLADCFAAALAKQRKLEIYTGDPEFKAVENQIKVTWI